MIWLACSAIGWVFAAWWVFRAMRRSRHVAAENNRLKQENASLRLELEERLDAEASARTQAQQALAAAEQANIGKTRFLAAASHDLRQPVHAIGLFVTALKLEALEGHPKYLVDRLDRSLIGLDDLFHRLLDLSRLDAGAVESSVGTFELLPLAQMLETRFSHLAQSRSLRFRVHCGRGLFVRSDPALLVEMIMNLLSNAFRYTPRGGILLAFRRRENAVLIQVWDTGCGIEQADLGLIFNEFVQLHNPSRDRRKGVGLGLSIVQRLSVALGHPLRVASRPGRGSVFEMQVERSVMDLVTADQEAQASTRDLSGMLVLVVDNEIDVLAAMEAILSAWGCFTILARSVDEALKYVDASPRFPDVLITDHRLAEGETGFDVADAVSAVLPHALPVIVVSGESSTDLGQRVRERGWTFMRKPVAASVLADSLKKAIDSVQVSM